MASEADVMAVAHESWERKRELVKQVREAVQALADNVYDEYSGFRQANKDAAYREATGYAEGVVMGSLESARIHLQGRMIDGR